MSKLVGIKTYERFRSLWENDAIDEFSLNFIIDTGLLYTHGIFINGAVFGTAANGAVPLSIAGITNTLALSSHTHSNYLEKNADIDISSYKIKSGDKDLLFYSGGSLYLGNITSPTYISGNNLYSVRGTNVYDILDTSNFSVSNTLPTGYTYNNTAYIKYGSNSHQIDYVKRINTSLSFDYLNTYTLAGTNLLNGVQYGYITLYTDNVYTNPSWAQLRINIPGKAIQYRTSADANTWINLDQPTISLNALNVAGIVSAPSSTTTNKVWKTDGSGNPAWRDELSYTFSNLKFLLISGTDLMTYNTLAVRTILAGSNISFSHNNGVLTINAQSPTYGVVSKTLAGLAPQLPNEDTVTKFLRQDGTWATPTYTSDTNTWREIKVNGAQKRSTSITSGDLNFINGSNTTVEWTSDNKLKINSTWTAWKGATDSANGTAGYMPAPTSALRGQFLRGDGSWVSLNNYSLPTASNSTLGGVKTGAAITDTTGYTAVAIKDGVIYYKDTNTTYSFSNLQFQQTSGTNLMTYNSQAARTVLAGSNITFTHSNNVLTIAAKDTTYSTVSKTAAGLCPTLPNETTTTKYLRLDGSWVTPPNDNTTYTFYNLQFQNSGGTTVDTYKPTTSPTKTLKAGSNVTISAASNIITIASTDTNTWRGILNNLTSDSTTDSLSAALGKALNNKFASYLKNTTDTFTGLLTVNGNGGLPLFIQGGTGGYRHGIIIKGAASWSGVLLGASDQSTSSITSNGYWIGNNEGAFCITKGSSGNTSTSLYCNGTNWYVNTNLILNSSNYGSYALPLSGGTLTGNLTGTRIWLNHNSNLSTSYSWTGSALTTPSIEVQNYTGTVDTQFPTITLHHYGYGGPRIGSRQGVLYIYGGDTDAKGLGSKNSYFKEMRIYPNTDGALYVNDNLVITAGNIGSLSVNYANSAGSANSVAWNNVSGKPSTYAPSSHTHNYIEAKGNYTFDSSTLPNSFDYGISAGFVNSNSGFGSYGSVLTVRTYSAGGGTLQLYAPYSNSLGGSHLKARFGDYGTSSGNSWTALKTVAWLDDIPSTIAWSNVSSKPETATRWPSWSEVTGKPSTFAPALPYRLSSLTSSTGYINNPDNARESGFWYCSANGPTSGGDCELLVVSHAASSWCHQLCFKFNNTGSTGTGYDGKDLWTRMYHGSNKAWTSWFTILTSGNVQNFALPISGGILAAQNSWLNPARLQLLRPNTTAYTDRACVGVTDGNLHIDAYSNKGLYLNFYSSGGNVYFNGNSYYINGGYYNGTAAAVSSITKAQVITALGYTPPTTNSTYNFSGTTFRSGYSSGEEHNANNAWENGHYYYTSNGPSGLGNSASDGALYVQSYNSSWVGQIAQDYRNGRLWVRGKNNGTWQAWVRIANYNEIPSTIAWGSVTGKPTLLGAINYNNNSNSTYQVLWGSGNACYGTAGIYVNPYYNYVYATTFYTTSDRSKKQDISEFSEHIRKFQMKDTKTWHYGVIAQEVPEMFRDGEEGNMTVNYSSVLSYYVGLLENRVKELEEKIKVLETKLNKLI